MGRYGTTFLLLPLGLAGIIPLLAAPAQDAQDLPRAVASALESADRQRLAALFPSDRKVQVSLHRIADLEGFSGSGPLVEAILRYVAKRSEVRFEPGEPEPRTSRGRVRLRGVLTTRASSGRRDRIELTFVFEPIDAELRVVEMRESG
jgi:hypothetical protein